MRLDHVAYATAPGEFLDVVQRLGFALGTGLSEGGRHPRFGTRNFILPLAGGTYVEVVTALDHPSTDTAPFRQAVQRRAKQGCGWLGWVVAVDDVTPVERRLGRPAADGNRRRPDGTELTWKQLGVTDMLDDPVLPFFVQWLVDPSEHPSAHSRGTVRIERLELAGYPARLADWLGAPADTPLDDVRIDWVDADEPGLVAVWFTTEHGVVRID